MLSSIEYNALLPQLRTFFGERLGPYIGITFFHIEGAIVAHYPEISWHSMERVFHRPTILTDTTELTTSFQYNGVQNEYIRIHIKAWEAARRILYILNGFEFRPLPKGKWSPPVAKQLNPDGSFTVVAVQDFYNVCYCPPCQAARREMERAAEDGEPEF